MNFFGKMTSSCFTCALLLSGTANAGLINGSFEDPSVDRSIDFPSTIPGWQTTDRSFEVWRYSTGIDAYDGEQFVELNAYIAGTLYQDVSGIAAGEEVGYQFAHRARQYDDETMRLQITDLGVDNIFGTADDTVLFNETFKAILDSWTFNTGGGLTALGNDIRFAYSAIDSGSIGNFLDAADFGIGVGTIAVPEPASITLFALGLLGLGYHRKNRLS